jgi:hypothetical protein
VPDQTAPAASSAEPGSFKMTAPSPFSCHICSEASSRICVSCTKDACDNHLCDKCHRCSDCCVCEVPLEEHPQSAT